MIKNNFSISLFFLILVMSSYVSGDTKSQILSDPIQTNFPKEDAANSDFDGYWATPQLTYAMEAKDASGFCSRLGGDSYTFVFNIQDNSMKICDIAPGNGWESQCAGGLKFEGGKLYLFDPIWIQFKFIAPNVILPSDSNKSNKDLEAALLLRIRTDKETLDKFSLWAQTCEF